MKLCLLSSSDGRGGAYAAAYCLHKGLLQVGADSTMLVGDKVREDSTVVEEKTKLAKVWRQIAPGLNKLPLQLYPNRDRAPYSLQWLPDAVSTRIAQLDPDVVNLHWICDGYLQVETIAQLNKPVVWTLHDMWAFTGGCHYNQTCDRYTGSCGACPQLHSSKKWDLSHWVWQRKAKAWKNLNLTVVTPSLWLAKCAKSSSLFGNSRVEVIPYGLNTERYKPINRQVARSLLNLPQDEQLVLFGGTNATGDRRKGFHLLQPALQDLSKSGWQLELVIFGSSQPSHLPNLGFKSHYLGKLSDDISLALVYAAADIFVAPSTQDNLPNTVMEALACGTPCVTFNIGGMPDMIEHQRNGYLAQPFKAEDLAQGIAWILENKERHQRLCDRAREKVEQEFTQKLQAHRYLKLFGEIAETYHPTRTQPVVNSGQKMN